VTKQIETVAVTMHWQHQSTHDVLPSLIENDGIYTDPTNLNLTKFKMKIINIYCSTKILYKNIFYTLSIDTSFVLLMLTF